LSEADTTTLVVALPLPPMTPPPSAVSDSARAATTRAWPAAVPSSEKPFSGSAPSPKRQRASSLAAGQERCLARRRAARDRRSRGRQKAGAGDRAAVPPRASPTAGVAAAGASAGGTWYANATSA